MRSHSDQAVGTPGRVDRIRRLETSGIRDLFDEAAQMPGAIHLEIGEPGFAPSPHVSDALASAVAEGLTTYTANAGTRELREAISRKARDRNGIDVDADGVVVTPGAIAALHTCLAILCEPGDRVLIPDPGWPNYRTITSLLGLEAHPYPVQADDGPELERIEAAITPWTTALILNSPNNPAGTVTGRSQLLEILELAAKYDLWVVSDEVYDELTFEGPSHSASALGAGDRVVSVFSFSKTYAMTGWRLGYALGDERVISRMAQAHQGTVTCASAPIQAAGLAALTGPQDGVATMREAFLRRRDLIVRRLLDAGIPATRPAGAFYVWADTSSVPVTGLAFARELLRETHVAVAPGTAFGASGRGFVRLSLGASQEDLEEGVDRIIQFANRRRDV